jgi:hypothetical protein
MFPPFEGGARGDLLGFMSSILYFPNILLAIDRSSLNLEIGDAK